MSMLLDLGLFLRENDVFHVNEETGERTKIIITSSIRGFLFTLACRIGSDPYTWVSQESLAEEMDMTVDGIKKLCSKSSMAGLIEVGLNDKDKRKNVYRPAEFLINYTQKRREKLSTIVGYGVFWQPKNVDVCTPKKSRKVDVCIPSRGTYVHLLSDQKHKKIKKKQCVTKQKKSGKEHRNNIKSKNPVLDVYFYPNYENQKLADQIGEKVGKTGAWLVKSFIDKIINRYGKTDNLNDRFRKFLLTELPAKHTPHKVSEVKQICEFL